MPEISIIVPVYNVEKYLSQCIESIIKQSFTDFELLLIDDGSTDNSGIICDEYEKKDNRIHAFHKKNEGLSDTRNFGLDRITGKYVMFIDSDDFINERCLCTLLNILRMNNADVSICDIQQTNENGSYEKESFAPIIETWTQDDFWKHWENAKSGYCVVSCNKLYCREVFENVRFPSQKIHEDVWVLHEWVNICKRIVFTNEKLYYYRQRNGSIMHKTFTIKNLEVVEALVQRAYYFQGKKMYNYAEKNIIDAMGRFAKGKSQIELSENNNEICFSLEKSIKQYNRLFLWHNTSWKYKVLAITFSLNLNLYKFVTKL